MADRNLEQEVAQENHDDMKLEHKPKVKKSQKEVVVSSIPPKNILISALASKMGQMIKKAHYHTN